MNTKELKPVIDALIFASDAPLSIQRIRQIVEEVAKYPVSVKTVREAVDEINRDNRENQRGFFLQEVAGGYQYRTRPTYAQWVKKLRKAKSFRLTQSTMETLAIIAYRQPLIKAEIEKIRGVDSGGIIKNLLERNIIKIVGRKNIPGRPFLFGTTKRFLEVFGLEKLADLPSLKEFEALDESLVPTMLVDGSQADSADSDGQRRSGEEEELAGDVDGGPGDNSGQNDMDAPPTDFGTDENKNSQDHSSLGPDVEAQGGAADFRRQDPD